MAGNIKVRVAGGPHKGGTKEYRILEAEGPNGTMLFCAFGKVGNLSNAHLILTKHGEDKTTFDGKLSERRSSGYDMRVGRVEADNGTVYTTVSSQELATLLTPAQIRMLELRHVRWLLGPNSSLDDIPRNASLVSDRQKMIAEMEAANAEATRKRAEAERAELEAETKNNPNWGLF